MQIVQRWVLAALRHRTFFSLAELNAAVARLLERLNTRPFRKLPGSRRSLFEQLDRPALRPLPTERYVFAEWKKARVNIDYHVEVEGHYYSVPHALIRRQLDVRLTATTVECLYRGQRVASHMRSSRKGHHTTVDGHMPEKHRRMGQWTPERFIRWAEKIGPHTAALITTVLDSRRHPQQAFRSCLGILRSGEELRRRTPGGRRAHGRWPSAPTATAPSSRSSPTASTKTHSEQIELAASDRAPQHPRRRLLLLRGHRHVDPSHRRQAPRAAMHRHGQGDGRTTRLATRSRTLVFEERLGLLVDRELTERSLATAHQPAAGAPSLQTRCMHRGHRLPRSPVGSTRTSSCRWPTGAGSANTSASSSPGPPASASRGLLVRWHIARAATVTAPRTGELPRLFTELAIARADGTYPKLLASLAKTEVLVIDLCEAPSYVESALHGKHFCGTRSDSTPHNHRASTVHVAIR